MNILNKLIYISAGLFLLSGFYYLSLSMHSFLEVRQFSQESKQFFDYTGENQEGYCYKTDIDFIATRSLYQTQSAKVIIFIKESEKAINLIGFSGNVVRNFEDQIQNFNFSYPNLIKTTASHFIIPGYSTYRVDKNVVMLYLGYNEVLLNIKGLMLKDPTQDIKVMLYFDNHKGTTVTVEFLMTAIKMFFIALILYIAIFIIKKKIVKSIKSSNNTGP